MSNGKYAIIPKSIFKKTILGCSQKKKKILQPILCLHVTSQKAEVDNISAS